MRLSPLVSSLSLALLATALACVPLSGASQVDSEPGYTGVQSVVALAGADLEVLEGSRVQLDGHASRSLLAEGELSLTWSQVDGPPVVLTNPSSPSPAFVAPLAPATLVFRLRAESRGGASLDEVRVVVREDTGAPPFFVEVPRDTAVLSGEAITFPATVVGNGSDVTIEAHPRCDGDVEVQVERTAITVLGTRELPCLIVIEGVDAQGRRGAPAARVLWPHGVPLPTPTRIAAPVVVEPDERVALSFEGPLDESHRLLWPAGGTSDGLSAASLAGELSLTAPKRRTRLILGGERRLGPVSGGIRYVFVDVTAGAGNRAPTADGGDDRGVSPGASFTLATAGSSDLDGDALLIDVTQVLGPAAASDELVPGLFHAPEVEDVLLFHVTAFDGTVYSAPDAVRVTVDAAVENQAPVLEVEPTRWVAPGTVFRVDASGAYDPDSGFIDRYSIAQDPSDPVLLLPEPVEDPFVELVAGDDGEVYRFRLSAFDEHGQGAFADLEVIVERAGPYVDAATGSDEGDGTASAPFRSLTTALEVARRHQFPALRVASGAQLPFAGTIVDMDVIGGHLRVGDEWTPGGEPTRLPIASGGVVLEDATLSRLELSLDAADSTLTLRGASALHDVMLGEGPLHEGPLFEVIAGATVVLSDVVATASTPSSGDAVLARVGPSAALRISDSTLMGAAGGRRIGLACEAATVDLIGSELSATTGAIEGTGIAAAGCDIQLLDSRVTGGAASARALGIAADDTLLYLAPDSVVSGAASGTSSVATALLVEGGDAPVVLVGALLAVEQGASAAVATGIDAGSSRVAIVDALVDASGSEAATALLARAGEAQVSGAALTALSALGDAVAVDLLGDESLVEHARLRASGARASGVRTGSLAGVFAPRLANVVVEVEGEETADGLSLGASRAVLATGLEVRVTAPGVGTFARALSFGDGSVRDSRFRVVGGGDVLGVAVAADSEGITIERSTVQVSSDGGPAVALLGDAPHVVVSSFLHATSPISAIGLDARAAVRLRHATIRADDTALLARTSTAALDAANTLLIGVSGFERSPGAPAPALASHLAMAAERPWVDDTGAVLHEAPALASAGCASCVLLAEPMIDDTGHLTDEDPHPLVDAGALEHAVAFDLDGDPIPFGALPDIGCDERVPPAAGEEG